MTKRTSRAQSLLSFIQSITDIPAIISGRFSKRVFQLVLLLILPLNLFSPLSAAEKPDAAITPLALFGQTTKTSQKIIFNRFENRLSHYYRLISKAQFEKARDLVFESVEPDQCTEKYCINRIQELLQVERLFFLDIVESETLTQLTITLVRTDSTLFEEELCADCGLEKLYRQIGALVRRLAIRDQGLSVVEAIEAAESAEVMPEEAFDQKNASEPGWLADLNSDEIRWHAAALTLALVAAWQSSLEAKAFNDLATENDRLDTQVTTVTTENDHQVIQARFDDNRQKMAWHKQNIVFLDLVTIGALVWEGWLWYRFLSVKTEPSTSNSSPPDVFCPFPILTGSEKGTIQLTLGWKW